MSALGRKRTFGFWAQTPQLMSAFGGKADVQMWLEIHIYNVCFVPKADINVGT